MGVHGSVHRWVAGDTGDNSGQVQGMLQLRDRRVCM